MFLRIRQLLLPLAFIAIFFLPYIKGSRLRPEVALLYTCIPLCFLLQRKKNSFDRKLLIATSLSAFFCLVCMLLSPSGKILADVILWTNLNFIFLAVCAFVAFRPWLIRVRFDLMRCFVVISIVVNIIAYLQFAYPDLAIHSKIFDLYGGYVRDPSKRGGFSTNAEFQVVAAHRYTSIFIGMHVLALFNVMSIGVGLGLLLDPTVRKGVAGRLFYFVALILAAMGGILAASKTFYFAILVFGGVLFALENKNRKRILYIAFSCLLCLLVYHLAKSAGDVSKISRVVETSLTFDPWAIIGTRYSEEGLLRETVSAIGSNFSLFMFGRGGDIRGFVMADSLFVPPFIVGGAIFFVLYMLQILILLRQNLIRSKGEYFLRIFTGLNFSFLVAGVGIPTYQVGRIAPLLVILNLCFIAAAVEKKLSADTNQRATLLPQRTKRA